MRKPEAEVAAPQDLQCHVLRRGDRREGSAGEMVLLSFRPSRQPRLTAAERDVGLAVARGMSNAQIAAERGASPRTVANQVAALLRKCGVTSRVELAGALGPLDFT